MKIPKPNPDFLLSSALKDFIYGSPILVNISFENPGPSSSITISEFHCHF